MELIWNLQPVNDCSSRSAPVTGRSRVHCILYGNQLCGQPVAFLEHTLPSISLEDTGLGMLSHGKAVMTGTVQKWMYVCVGATAKLKCCHGLGKAECQLGKGYTSVCLLGFLPLCLSWDCTPNAPFSHSVWQKTAFPSVRLVLCILCPSICSLVLIVVNTTYWIQKYYS